MTTSVHPTAVVAPNVRLITACHKASRGPAIRMASGSSASTDRRAGRDFITAR